MHLGEEDDIDQVRTQRPENRGFVNYHHIIFRMLRMCLMLEILRIFTKDRRWWVLWGPWRLPSHPLQRWPLASPTWSQSHSPVIIHLTSKKDIRERKIQAFLGSFVKLNQSVLVMAHFYIIDMSLIDWLMFRFYYSTNLKGFELLCHFYLCDNFSHLINQINLHFVWR